MLLGRRPVRVGRSATKQGSLGAHPLSQAREGLRQRSVYCYLCQQKTFCDY